jgi:hypothetical protein
MLVAVASLLLAGLYVLPLWTIQLAAPQYPEGIGLHIHIDAIEGAGEFDITKINNLNHYIGMRAIDADEIPELRVMPWLLGALVAAGLLVAALGRRRLLYGWLGALVTFGVLGLVDFWRWGYDYGHNLDHETAVIEVPGMTYQPPVIGTKRLLNFTATSLPAEGAWLAGAAVLLAAAAVFLSRRHRPAPPTVQRAATEHARGAASAAT